MTDLLSHTTPSELARKMRLAPAYTIADAARYLGLPYSTLRYWFQNDNGNARAQVKGGVLSRPREDYRELSFVNLVEAYVLKALTRAKGLRLEAIRKAVDYAREELQIERPLLDPNLRTDRRHLFLQQLERLINLSRSGQLAMRTILEQYLERIEWEDEVPARFFPDVAGVSMPSPIQIDPLIAYGKPAIRGRGVPTWVIVRRIDLNETAEEVARDYDLTTDEIEAAVVYERTA